MRNLILTIAAVLAVSSAIASKESESNYCDDQASADKWIEIADKNPANDDIQALHALRIGLCEKIEDGSIKNQRAIILFERFHQAVLAGALEEKSAKEAAI